MKKMIVQDWKSFEETTKEEIETKKIRPTKRKGTRRLSKSTTISNEPDNHKPKQTETKN